MSTFFRVYYLFSFFRGSVLGPFSLGGLGVRRGGGRGLRFSSNFNTLDGGWGSKGLIMENFGIGVSVYKRICSGFVTTKILYILYWYVLTGGLWTEGHCVKN